MNGFELCFELPWLLLLFIPAAVIIWRSYRYSWRGGRRRKERMTLLLLRLFSALMATLILSGFTVVTDRVGDSVMLLVDVSDSLTGRREELSALSGAVLEALPDGVDVKAAAFDSKTQPLAVSSLATGMMALPNAADGSVTDISGALNHVLDSLPSNTHRRVILLSDGLETNGDALMAARTLASKGIQVDAIPVKAASDAPEAEIRALHVPAEAFLGTQCEMIATVISSSAEKGTLTLLEEGEILQEQSVKLKKGETRVSFHVTMKNAGRRVFSVELRMDSDVIAENNCMSACVSVTASRSVLLVAGVSGAGRQLMELLDANGYEAEMIAPKDFPRNMSELCRYGLVILSNVNERDLRGNASELMEEYVRVYGRSVLATGGTNTYVYGGFLDTPLEEFLPLAFNVEEKESKESIALILAIDCSASMGRPIVALASSTLTPLELAKRGAIKCFSALHKNDFIGIISFSDNVYMMQELTSAANEVEVVTAIARMAPVSGTQYTGPLYRAGAMLSDFRDAERKHVIFLSDGNAGDTGFEQAVTAMHDAGITLSAIAVGTEIDAEVMRRLAELGGGRYFQAEDPNDLPSVMLSDTVMQQVQYEVKERFLPILGRSTQLFGEIQELPELDGYIRTEARDAAELSLTAPDGSPIYAWWRYGQGMAGAFTSDLDGVWSARWFESEQGQAAALRIVEGLMPEDNLHEATQVEIMGGGADGILRVTSADAQERQMLTAEITRPDGSTQSVSLSARGNGVYEQMVLLQGSGEYGIHLHRFDANGCPLEDMETMAVVSWSQEYEAFPDEQAAALLETICGLTGGRILQNAGEAAAVDMRGVFIEYDPTHLLILLCVGAVLLELLLRYGKRLLDRIKMAR